MSIFRVLRPLSRKHEQIVPRGTLTALDWLKPEQQQRLIDVGAVSRISAPPLASLPGWIARGGHLGRVGIHTFDDFLERTDAEIAELVNKRETTIARWRAELISLITVPQRGGRG